MEASFGVPIVQGEVLILLAATRKGSRWSSHGRNDETLDPLILGLYQLQELLNSTRQLSDIDVCAVIRPFCQIIQSDDTTGPITGMAISSLEKFLGYNLIDSAHPNAPSAVESLSEAVTHARFVGTNPASDEVVLMRILQVLRTLMLSPVGRLLTNESVCEIMQSCFRICFEMRLSELLRCYGESTLVDLVQLLFSQLQTFSEDSREDDKSSPMDQTLMTPQQETPPPSEIAPLTCMDDATTSVEPTDQPNEIAVVESQDPESESTRQSSEVNDVALEEDEAGKEVPKDKVLTPYGLPCVRELLRFLVSIINTQDSQANSDALVAIGLNLVTMVIESGSMHLYHFPGLACLVQDSLCRHLLQLLRHDSFVLFSRALRCCCLLFQSCRSWLKLQLEMFMMRLMELIATDGSSRAVHGKRELALESIVQLCHIPHFTAELFVNFDCGLYCTNVFQNLTKLLSKNSFPTQGAISYAHLLALEALLAIVNDVEADGGGCGRLTSSLQVGSVEGQRTECSNYGTQINSAGIIFSNQQLNTGLDLAEADVSHSCSSPSLLQDTLPSHGRNLAKGVSADNETGPASGYEVGESSCDVDIANVGAVRKPVAPSGKDLLEVRQRKKLILAATEIFNKKRPKDGILFLCEQRVLKSPPDPLEVADFLRENPWLTKAKIGEYIGKSHNVEMLEAFVSKQKLRGVTLLDALRVFLEAFRLPGEAQIVTRVLELFSQYWLDSNSGPPGCLGEVFANRDAVFVLSYSIMMLNTDLHNEQNKKKMTVKEYIKNHRKTNNGKSFQESFLSEIYNKIRDEEIIMPAEHSGAVRENYQWKRLIQRSTEHYFCVSDSSYAYDIYLILWGPTIAALSYVYDHADDKTITQKTISGFSKCASVAAHFELKEVFDNLIISLCKFTSLLNNHETSSSLFYSLGVNPKVRQSVRTMFALAHSYGNILREGWKDLLDCLLSLFKAQLLPKQMIEVPDFLKDTISLYRNEAPCRNESSLFSSFYSYFAQESGTSSSVTAMSAGGGGVAGGRGLSASEGKARSAAIKCIQECHPEQLFVDSRFLKADALLELVKALIFASRSSECHQSLGTTTFDESGAVFFLGILVTVAIENKDRSALFWRDVSTHLSSLILSAKRHHHFLLERGVVFLLHLVLRLLGRGDFPIDQVLSSLTVFLSLPPPSTPSLSNLHLQIAHGINEIVRTHATTFTTAEQWQTIFTFLEFAGAGINRLPRNLEGSFSDGSSSPVQDEAGSLTNVVSTVDGSVGAEGSNDIIIMSSSFGLLDGQILPVHEPQAFFKACECLSFLTRSDHLINTANFTYTLRCIRHFSEISTHKASLEYDKPPGSRRGKTTSPTRRERSQKGEEGGVRKIPASSVTGDGSSLTYASSLLQLLDLLDALYSKVGQIFDLETVEALGANVSVAKVSTRSIIELGQVSIPGGLVGGNFGGDAGTVGTDGPQLEGCGFMWRMAWCPILQAMAHLCCNSRASVRQISITYLQRALLSHDLHNLSGDDWHACFTQMFFPMLTRLLEEIETRDRLSLEETRVRACNLLCKVFLQHLPAFPHKSKQFGWLWMEILNYMELYLHLMDSELLCEAIPESLKNMLLVMSTQGVFDNCSFQSDSSDILHSKTSSHTPRTLWLDTWARIDKFLPNFVAQLFPNETHQPCSLADDKPLSIEVVGTGDGGDGGDGGLNFDSQCNDSDEFAVGVAKECLAPPTEDADSGSSPLPIPSSSSSRSSLVMSGASPGSSPPLPPHIPPSSVSRTSSSPVTPPSSSVDLESSFPVILHPPLPTISSSRTQPDETASVVGPMMGPILIPAAPPYSDSNESETNSNEGPIVVPFSSFYSL